MFVHSVGGGTCAVFDVVGFDMILMTKVKFFFCCLRYFVRL